MSGTWYMTHHSSGVLMSMYLFLMSIVPVPAVTGMNIYPAITYLNTSVSSSSGRSVTILT